MIAAGVYGFILLRTFGPGPNLIRGKYHRDGSTPQNFITIVDGDRNPHRSRFIGFTPRQAQRATRSTLPILLHGDEHRWAQMIIAASA